MFELKVSWLQARYWCAERVVGVANFLLDFAHRWSAALYEELQQLKANAHD